MNEVFVCALLRGKGGPPVFTKTGWTFSTPGPQGLVRPPAYAQNLFTCCLRLACSQIQHLQWAVRWRAWVAWIIVFNVYDIFLCAYHVVVHKCIWLKMNELFIGHKYWWLWNTREESAYKDLNVVQIVSLELTAVNANSFFCKLWRATLPPIYCHDLLEVATTFVSARKWGGRSDGRTYNLLLLLLLLLLHFLPFLATVPSLIKSTWATNTFFSPALFFFYVMPPARTHYYAPVFINLTTSASGEY